MGRHHPMHARRQSQAHEKDRRKCLTPPRPRGLSDATSVKPQSSCSTPPAAAPPRSPTRPRFSPASPLRSRRPALSSARPPAAMSAICWPPSSPPASRPAEPTPARSRPSSARLERWANPTPSTPPRAPDTAGTASPNFRFGAPASPSETACTRWSSSDATSSRIAWLDANRRAAPAAAPVHPYLEAIVESFDAQIKAIEADINALCAACEPIAKAVNVLIAIPGVGQKTAAALMPELGSLPPRQAAALAGLAPHPNQSGQTDAYRRTRGGRPEVKRVLFMAAISAAKHHPTLSAFYKRLLNAGKKPLVAITAIMRKLVVIATPN